MTPDHCCLGTADNREAGRKTKLEIPDHGLDQIAVPDGRGKKDIVGPGCGETQQRLIGRVVNGYLEKGKLRVRAVTLQFVSNMKKCQAGMRISGVKGNKGNIHGSWVERFITGVQEVRYRFINIEF